MPNRKKLGEMLLENGFIDEVQLEGTLTRQKQWGGRLGENLVKQGFVSEITLLKFLSKQLNLPCADLCKIDIKPEVYNLISVKLAQKHKVLPLQLKQTDVKSILYVAMSDPTDDMAIDEIRFMSGHMTNSVIATSSQIESAIEKYYFNDEVQIIPLVERLPSIELEAELEIVHEVPIEEQLDIEKTKNLEINNQEVLALILLLDEKGLLGKDEYLGKLAQLREEGD